ncbi:hypothetical protein [Prosthecobacter fluviatilis]|uniref:Type II secretion system protein GspG C-terminal domain-containing protein n=1 Tax=Prosthecobacter fluviatilis TaxID=445931 RepID=A0ABW0KUD4_9BACT
MSEPTTPGHDPRSRKKKGCLWFLIFLGVIIVLILLYLPMVIVCPGIPDAPRLRSRAAIKHLQAAITAYEIDSAHFPVPESDWHGPDVSLRTRGLILPILLGRKEAKALNPKEIKFIDLPMARDHKNGLWQEGNEWVLSDPWGEPYYLILDTNDDLEIANPEFGARASDPKQAEFDLKHPQPKMLPLTTAIYSSGPDRDSKTWQDNVCSWHTR